MGLVVEVVTRSGRVIERHNIRGEIATIGRAYSNDVIVSDPYMDREHARVSVSEEGLLIESYDDSRITTVTNESIRDTVVVSGTEAVLGRTRIRLLSKDHPVPKALTQEALDKFFSILAKPRFVIIGVLVFLLFTAINQHLSSFFDVESIIQVRYVLERFLVVFVIGVFWAIVGRVARHEPRFWYHLWAGLLFTLFLMFIPWLGRWVAFNTNSVFWDQWVSVLSLSLALALLVELNLRFALQLRRWVRRMSAMAIALVSILFFLVDDLANSDKFRAAPVFAVGLLPETFLFRSGIEVDRYVLDIETVFED